MMTQGNGRFQRAAKAEWFSDVKKSPKSAVACFRADVRILSLTALATVLLLSSVGPGHAATPENLLYLDVPQGRVVIELRPDLAPKTVAHIKANEVGGSK